MKKGQIVVLFVALILSVGVLVGLYALSPLSKKIYRASFERSFMDGYLRSAEAMVDLEVNSFYIAGYSDRQLYLGNFTAPFHLLKTNLSLRDSQHVMLKVRVDSIHDFKRFRLSVAPPFFYLAHGVEPIILKGDTSTWSAIPFIKDRPSYFSDAVPLSPSTFAFRSYSKTNQSCELARATADDFTFHAELLQKQIDGLFCVDGKLLFNARLNRLVYLYYYRNQFIVADTNLTLSYRGHTIDTFSHVRIKVAKVGDGGESTLASPPMVINGVSCTDGDFLYVQSALLAKNEDEQKFRSSSTVDAYRLMDGQYVGSFHVPAYAGKKMSGFQVIGDRLFGIFDKYLISFLVNLHALHPSSGGEEIAPPANLSYAPSINQTKQKPNTYDKN
jgi:hypothetical protein